jgi:hypothetical protein
MGVSWKQIAQGLRMSVSVGAQFAPPLALVDQLIGAAERIGAGVKGHDKKAAVIEVSDEILALELPGLTDAQRDAIRQARSAYIDLFVAAQKAKSAAEKAKAELADLIAAFHPVASPDGTGHP